MRHTIIIAVALLCASGMAAAQEAADEARTLSLQECIDIALERNPSIAIADEMARAGQANERRAWAAYLPRLDARSRYQITRSRGGRKVIPGVGVITVAGQVAQPDIHGVYLSQTILQTGRSDAVREARHQARADKHAAADVRRELVRTVAENYYAVLANRRLQDVALQSAAFEDENVRIVQGRIAVGIAAPVDVRPALAERARAQLDVVRAENAVNLALAQLKNTLGLPPTERIDVAESLQEEPEEVNLEEALSEAYEKRPDLAERREQVKAARNAVKASRAQTLPQIAVAGESAYDVLDAFGSFTYQFSAALSYPVFDGGASKAELDIAKANLKSAQASLEQTRLAIGLDVESAVLNVREAAERTRAARSAVDEAQANFEAMQGRLREGLVTTQDVTEAEIALTSARVEEVQAIYDFNVSLVQLDAAIGRQ